MSAWLESPRSPFVRTGSRERKRAETRERLYAAALAEFRSKGFARANVSDIARAAGVSRPSFYAHFPSVDHVLFELVWRLSLDIVRRLESAAGLRATLDRLLEGLIAAEAAVGDPALFREMISMFAPVTAASCAFWGISGRSTGTSCAALTLETAMTCVTTSSEVALTWFGRSLPGSWRMLASGSTLMMLPAGTAMKPCTCSTDRNPW